MAGGLLTDLYELNMAASYLHRGMTGQATFSLFAGRLPPGRGFLIAAGLEDCLAFLESFSFTGTDLAYLRAPRTTARRRWSGSGGCGSPAMCGRSRRAPPCSPPSRCLR